jgi:PAS domain S-box-containing protein
MRPPELSELEAFVLALEEGSINRAAGRLQISPPATAKRIHQLELIARNPLLVRGPRGVRATEMGERLYPIARELLAQRRLAVGALRGEPPADPLRIAGMHHLLGSTPSPPAEDLLKDTEAFLAAIFHASAEAIIVARAQDGLIHEVNEAAVCLLGYEQEELRGRTVSDVDLWEAIGSRDEGVQQAIATQEPERTELVLRTRTGERRRVAARFEAIHLRGALHLLITISELPGASVGTKVAGGHRAIIQRLEAELEPRFLDALRHGEAISAEAAANDALAQGADLGIVHAHLIEPAMRSIGELWQRGEISIADEHLATGISHQVAARIARIVGHATPAPRHSRARVMMAAVQGEQHSLGLRLAADVLEDARHEVLYLGADVPLEALLQACRGHQPDILALTVTMSLNVPTLIGEIDEVTKLELPPRVMIGGRAGGAAARLGLRVPVVEHSDRVLETTERLLADPPSRALLPRELGARMAALAPLEPARN